MLPLQLEPVEYCVPRIQESIRVEADRGITTAVRNSFFFQLTVPVASLRHRLEIRNFNVLVRQFAEDVLRAFRHFTRACCREMAEKKQVRTCFDRSGRGKTKEGVGKEGGEEDWEELEAATGSTGSPRGVGGVYPLGKHSTIDRGTVVKGEKRCCQQVHGDSNDSPKARNRCSQQP